jgi:hypothetical protein
MRTIAWCSVAAWVGLASCGGAPSSTPAPMMPASALPDGPSTARPKAPRHARRAPVPPAAAVAGRLPTLLGVSVDRRHALLRLEKQSEHWNDPMYRWVDIETQEVLEEWREPALSGMPLETMRDGGGVIREPGVDEDALHADIATHATALLEAGGPFEPRFAVTPETSMLNLGDWLYVAETRTGKVGARLAKAASYYPHVAPDGSFVVYSRMNGFLRGGYLGNYMPYVVPLPAGAPSRRIEVRDIDGWKMTLSPDGRYLYVQSGTEQPDGGCVVRATIDAPSAVKKLYCVAKDERIRDLAFSPSRHMVVATIGHSDIKNRATRAVWIALPDGTVAGELRQDAFFDVATVDETGRALASGVPESHPMARLDPKMKLVESYETDVRVPYNFYGAAWIGADRWVFGEGGGTRTIDLSALRKTAVPWPSP